MIVYEGGIQTFNFTVNAGYHMTDLLVNGTSIDPVPGSYTFSGVTADHTIEAVFTQVHTIEASVNDASGGTIDPSGDVIVYEGGNQTSNFTVNAGPPHDRSIG